MSLSPDQTSVLTLDSLLMRTGPLSDLVTDVSRWTTIAGKLRASYPVAEWGANVAELCTVYYKHGKNRFVHRKPYGKAEQLGAVADFLEFFMTQNGQWPYIKNQPWYTSGKYVIAVDINYYPDRSGHKVAPAFHKDTGGNNIFVNLIFDNEAPIEATEWFADLAQPSVQRAEWQAKLLPSEHLDELAAARKVLAPKHEGADVSGGITKGKHAFVSWVDDLVWHATPSTAKRLVLTADLAIGLYAPVGAQLTKTVTTAADKEFQFYDQTAQSWISALSVIGSIAECPTTGLHKWLADQRLGPQDVTDQLAPKAWRELYTGDKGRATYEHDVRERAATDWRVSATANEANAEDPTLPGSTVIKETPVGLSGRRRTNSKSPEAIEVVSTLTADVPRTFIRTWVRILPADRSEELATNHVEF